MQHKIYIVCDGYNNRYFEASVLVLSLPQYVVTKVDRSLQTGNQDIILTNLN